MDTNQAPAAASPGPPAAATAAAPPATAAGSLATQPGQQAAPMTTQPGQAAAAPPSLLTAPAAVIDVPDKFKVTKADGTLDHEATLQKALGSMAHLEKRLGTGDVPPETEAGYKLDYAAFPAEVKLTPEGEKAFLKSMHSAGLTNKQVQAVLNKYGEVIKAGMDLQQKQASDSAAKTLTAVAEELKQAWGPNNDANVRAAQRGFNHLADEADRKDIARIGVDAGATYRILMKVLARVGQGIQEDTQIVNADSAGDADIEALKRSEAYTNANHKDHAAAVAKVTAWYQRKYPKK